MKKYRSSVDENNPYKNEKTDYYKTHACPKGKYVFNNTFVPPEESKSHVKTLTTFLLKTLQRGDLVKLILNIATAIKIISGTIRGKCKNELAALGFQNYPKWVDSRECEITLTDIFNSQIKKSGGAYIIGCRLYENPVKVSPSLRGKYVVVVSPIDGPRDCMTTGCMGSVFGIYPIAGDKKRSEQVLQKGSNLLCSGYALYGSSTVLYIALRGRGTHGFILQTDSGEFLLTDPHVKVPASGPLYSLDEGRCIAYEDWFLEWLHYIKNPPGGNKLAVVSRSTNSKVADIHQIMKWGGLYIRPHCEMSDVDNPHFLVYEMIPLGFLLEEAGGLGTTGRHLLIDFEPKSLHETCQAFLGSKINVILLLMQINPSLLVKARIYTLRREDCQGGIIGCRKRSQFPKKKQQVRSHKTRKRKN